MPAATRNDSLHQTSIIRRVERTLDAQPSCESGGGRKAGVRVATLAQRPWGLQTLKIEDSCHEYDIQTLIASLQAL